MTKAIARFHTREPQECIRSNPLSTLLRTSLRIIEPLFCVTFFSMLGTRGIDGVFFCSCHHSFVVCARFLLMQFVDDASNDVVPFLQ